MILLILVVGCLFFLCIGIGIASWAGVDMQIDGPDIMSIIMFICGVGLIVFGLFCIAKASEYYNERESPKTEIKGLLIIPRIPINFISPPPRLSFLKIAFPTIIKRYISKNIIRP